MHKIWTIMIDVAIAIGIMFLSVMIYYGLRTETVIKSMVTNMTEDMMFEVKEDGELTLLDYERYIEKLSYTNTIYDIELEHRYTLMEPEYRFRTLEEIIAAQNAAYKGSNEYHYKEIISELPVVHDPVNTDNLNTETNESVLRNSVDKPADPNHIHTDECYGGHQHQGTKLFPHVHKHSSTCRDFVHEAYVDYTCSVCGYEGTILREVIIWDSTFGSTRTVTFMPVKCYNSPCSSTNIITRKVYFSYGYSCYYDIDLDGDGLEDLVDRTKEYTYYRSSPQEHNINVSQEYTNGCYSTTLKGYFSSTSYGAGDRIYGGYSVMDGLRKYGLNAFCEIPRRYSFKVTCYDTSDNYYEILFSFAAIQSNGTFIFHDGNGNYFTFEEFLYYTNNSDNAKEFLKKYHYMGYVVDSGVGLNYQNFEGALYICDHERHNVWTNNCGLEEGGGLACDKIIVNLTPTHPVQKVFIGDDIISTARATYLNGSEKTILCNTDFVVNELGQDIPVTLWSSYTIVNREYTKTCEIVVTVIPRTNICGNGHMYYLTEDGIDPGCPYCKAWAKNLRVIYPNIPTLTITIGSTLIDNNIQILVTYMSGATEVISNGYIDNLDSGYLGTQRVTIGYKGALTTVMVTTVRVKILCEICGYEYELYPDGENPGCPRCLAKTPIFTGNILTYQKVKFTEEILSILQNKRSYKMNKNDTFVISVESKTATVGRRLLRKIYPSITDQWMFITKNIRVRTK